jgi:hypothetical protein
LISDPKLIVISWGLVTSDDETIRLSGCDINSRFTPQKDSGKSQETMSQRFESWIELTGLNAAA